MLRKDSRPLIFDHRRLLPALCSRAAWGSKTGRTTNKKARWLTTLLDFAIVKLQSKTNYLPSLWLIKQILGLIYFGNRCIIFTSGKTIHRAVYLHSMCLFTLSSMYFWTDISFLYKLKMTLSESQKDLYCFSASQICLVFPRNVFSN